MANWIEENQRYLFAELDSLKKQLERYKISANTEKSAPESQQNQALTNPPYAEKSEISGNIAIEKIVRSLGLSPFERNVLLMCAGVELDSEFASLLHSLQDGSLNGLPTFSLALSIFQDAHWSALTPNAPLRYWRLIQVIPGNFITRSGLRIDEHVLHFITGVRELDYRLGEIVSPVYGEAQLVPSAVKVSDEILYELNTQKVAFGFPVVHFTENNESDELLVAEDICTQLGLKLYRMQAPSVPLKDTERTELNRLWNRESALHSLGLFLDCRDIEASDINKVKHVTDFINNVQGLIIVSCGKWKPSVKRAKIAAKIKKPTPSEQLLLWEKSLGDEAARLNGQLKAIVSQFDMSASDIAQAGSEVLKVKVRQETSGEVVPDLNNLIWKSCCRQTSLSLDELVHRLEPVSSWDDLILPETHKEVLRNIITQVRERNKVYEDWGFAAKSSRGFGISALFAGESGTGKTMASEVLAKELDLDLYRVDLSQVVSKYIGETEKNLRKIFDAAEGGGAILLFDEADALFGKRSEVKDSHDRYSNIEVSYLLQRMEEYRGLAVLTSNMKNALDKAFLRRFRFVVQFPFPDAVQRTEIWKRVFPAQTPTNGLDPVKLSRLNVAGGNIKNIALNAAFLAASEGEAVGMVHISRAARSEYYKLDKPLSPAEINGW